ncbi:L,D-transpeptidase [Akkermansiaceae bacterium]|nr:L,D-transpeptidase [Akkermansiaceae bacterium]
MTPAPESRKWPEVDFRIEVSIPNQRMTLYQGASLLFQAPISSALNGIGFSEGSYQTPTGNFIVREKIGDGAPLNTRFTGRLPRSVWQGEECRDDILTRIFWLEGLQDQNANTYRRYIYFHGTHSEELIGTPASHGCIRLRNEDMLTLFDLTPLFTHVTISL